MGRGNLSCPHPVPFQRWNLSAIIGCFLAIAYRSSDFRLDWIALSITLGSNLRACAIAMTAFNRVVRWLATHQQDYLSEFQKIAEIDTLGPIAETPGA